MSISEKYFRKAGVPTPDNLRGVPEDGMPDRLYNNLSWEHLARYFDSATVTRKKARTQIPNTEYGCGEVAVTVHYWPSVTTSAAPA